MTLTNPQTAFISSSSDALPGELPELLTWEEICHRYPKEWVILVDTVDRDLDIGGGRVMAHGPDKHVLVPAMHEAIARYGHVGRYFTGIKRTWKFRSYAQRNI